MKKNLKNTSRPRVVTLAVTEIPDEKLVKISGGCSPRGTKLPCGPAPW